MRITILTLFFISNIGFAQNNLANLKFDTKYFDAVDKWVAFPKNDEDSTYTYGIIYFDYRKGFIFKFYGKFKVKADVLLKVKLEAQEVEKLSRLNGDEYYLRPNTKLVCVLNENQITSLNLSAKPKWISKNDEHSDKIEYLFRLGFELKRAGAFNLALKPFLKAYKIEPHIEYLEMHLSDVYMSLGRYEDAIKILKKGIENDSKNHQLYLLLTHSLVKLNKIDEAEETCLEGIKLLDKDNYKFRIAAQMASEFSNLGNKKKFDEWVLLTKKFANPNWVMFKDDKDIKKGIEKYIEELKKSWNKK